MKNLLYIAFLGLFMISAAVDALCFTCYTAFERRGLNNFNLKDQSISRLNLHSLIHPEFDVWERNHSFLTSLNQKY